MQATLNEILGGIRERAITDGRTQDVADIERAIGEMPREEFERRVSKSFTLTPAQMAVAYAIHRYIKDRHMAPTYDELATELSVTKVTIHEHISELERKRFLEREKRKSRSVFIVPDLGGDRC